MQSPNLRYIITGGPGFGKTSIINALEAKGYAVCHENSREVITQQLAIGGTILPWMDLDKFSDIIIEKRLEAYQRFNGNTPIFYDRGLPDTLAFIYRQNQQPEEKLLTITRTHPYNTKVFITPPWYAIFKNDNERRETFAEAVIVHQYLSKTYADLGYKLIDIPPASVEERVAFILAQIA